MKKLQLFIFLVFFSLTAGAWGQEPRTMMDNTWISLSGTVDSINSDSFMLDYGDGAIRVELEDWDWYPETSVGLVGEKVTVSGEVDHDFFESSEIKADSVYLESAESYYWVSPDISYYYYYPYTTPIDLTLATMEGVVTEVRDDEFVMASDGGSVIVELERPGDPGLQNLAVGDRVRVTGEMDYDLFEGHEFEADSMVVLR